MHSLVTQAHAAGKHAAVEMTWHGAVPRLQMEPLCSLAPACALSSVHSLVDCMTASKRDHPMAAYLERRGRKLGGLPHKRKLICCKHEIQQHDGERDKIVVEEKRILAEPCMASTVAYAAGLRTGRMCGSNKAMIR